MYEYIEGMITEIKPTSIVLEHQGIGYDIIVPNSYSYVKLDVIKMYVYQYVREDIIALYGFHDAEEKTLFLKLISVSGIGPKSAMSILASGKTKEVFEAISAGDAKYLTKFPGIGQKASQQIILDLQGKLEPKSTQTNLFQDPSKMEDVSLALQSLGYREKEIKKVTEKLDPNKPINELIKEALQWMLK